VHTNQTTRAIIHPLMNEMHPRAPSDPRFEANNMDSPLRLPRQQSIRAKTNVAPDFDEPQEERITPPLEVFVREMALMGLMESSMTEVTFENSSLLHMSGFTTFSAASSMSSLADCNSVPITSGDDEPNQQSLRRLPSRIQSYRKAISPRRGRRKCVARWASMPPKRLPSRALADASPFTQGGPQLPRRRGSENADEEAGQTNIDLSDNSAVMPRMPIRVRSSGSLFSKSTSGTASRSTRRRGKRASDKEEEQNKIDLSDKSTGKPRKPIRMSSSSSLFGNSVPVMTSAEKEYVVVSRAHEATSFIHRAV
jgi:hypothetical protein